MLVSFWRQALSKNVAATGCHLRFCFWKSSHTSSDPLYIQLQHSSCSHRQICLWSFFCHPFFYFLRKISLCVHFCLKFSRQLEKDLHEDWTKQGRADTHFKTVFKFSELRFADTFRVFLIRCLMYLFPHFCDLHFQSQVFFAEWQSTCFTKSFCQSNQTLKRTSSPNSRDLQPFGNWV